MKTKKKTEGTPKQVIIDALETVKPAVAGTGAPEEALSHFAFDGKSVMACNESTYITTPLKTELECTVIADPFYNLIKNLGAKNIKLSMEGTEVSVKTKNTRSKFRTLHIQDFPKKPTSKGEGERLPKNFFRALDLCQQTVNRTHEVPFMRAIAIVGGKMVSSDSYRYSNYPNMKVKDFILPIEGVESVLALKDNILNYQFISTKAGEPWIGFQLGTGGMLSARLYNADFPFEEHYFTHHNKTIILPEHLKKTMERCSYFSNGVDELSFNAVIGIKDGRLSCKINNPVLGEFEEEMKTEIKGSYLFQINLGYLKAILNLTTTMMFDTKKMNTVYFKTEEGFMQLIALA